MRKRDRTSRKKHSSSLNATMNSSRISQPKDPDKGKWMARSFIKEEKVDEMDEHNVWKEVSSCRWSLVREQENNKKRKSVAHPDPPRSFDTMAEYEALLREGSTKDIRIKKESDGSECRKPSNPSNVDMEGSSTDRPRDSDQGDSSSNMTIKKEEIDEGGLAKLPIEIPAIERKRNRSRHGDSTEGIEAKKESIDVSMKPARREKKRRMARIQDETNRANEDKRVIARRVASLANFALTGRTNPVTETSLLQITPFLPAEVLAYLRVSPAMMHRLDVQIHRIFQARGKPMRLRLRTLGIRHIITLDDSSKGVAQVHARKDKQSEKEGPEEPKIKEEDMSEEEEFATSRNEG